MENAEVTYYNTSVSFLDAVLGYSLTEVTAMRSQAPDQLQINPKNLTRMVRCSYYYVCNVFFSVLELTCGSVI